MRFVDELIEWGGWVWRELGFIRYSNEDIGLTWVHLGALEFTWDHLGSLGLTWVQGEFFLVHLG